MKKRLLTICVAIITFTLFSITIMTLPIWILAWFFTGFDITDFYFNIFDKLMKKYNL